MYGFPKPRAAAIAVDTTRSWLETESHGIDRVVFVCFDTENLALYEALLG